MCPIFGGELGRGRESIAWGEGDSDGDDVEISRDMRHVYRC